MSAFTARKIEVKTHLSITTNVLESGKRKTHQAKIPIPALQSDLYAVRIPV